MKSNYEGYKITQSWVKVFSGEQIKLLLTGYHIIFETLIGFFFSISPLLET